MNEEEIAILFRVVSAKWLSERSKRLLSIDSIGNYGLHNLAPSTTTILGLIILHVYTVLSVCLVLPFNGVILPTDIRRKHYGTSTSRLRYNDSSSASSDTA